ncbi:SGNH/GDSL hydrolase family protein [Fulvivirga maritima]|uniref:SGNH/GDSL hydrolase family protein n=1 Tax=Fulvivirga maritima TaxID=2904247 RepID=UPI001F263B53|nr:SGNH/GDSL hydrolase family protein [Fulvivirga maritima]UII26550.1 SGNH/GDSL hydrolase family protein [Fulvivirga maritima]
MFFCIILLALLNCTSDNDMIYNPSNHPDSTQDSLQGEGLSFLALGDSYTIGERVTQIERWPVQLVNAINHADNGYAFAQPKIIARTGWTTQELKAGIAAENPVKNYDFVSLLIGVNNQYRGQSVETYQPEFEELLNMAIEFAGGDKEHVIVLSIPDYGYTPFGANKKEEITKAIYDYNEVNRKVSEELGVKYFDITAISRTDEADMVASDGLHPSGKQYKAWVELILKDDYLNSLFQ